MEGVTQLIPTGYASGKIIGSKNKNVYLLFETIRYNLKTVGKNYCRV